MPCRMRAPCVVNGRQLCCVLLEVLKSLVMHTTPSDLARTHARPAAAPPQEPDADEAAAEEGDAAGPGPGSAAAAAAERVLGESKKDPALRRRELLGGKGGLGGPLVGALCGAAGKLLRDQWGCDVVVEAARGAEGGLLWELERPQVEALHASILAEAAGSSSGGEEEEGEGGKPAEPLLTDYWGSRALRRLVLAGAAEGPSGEGARAFVSALWAGTLAGHCKQWVGGHAEKVLAALLHCGEGSVEAAARRELQGLVAGPLDGWADKFLGPKAQPGGQQQPGKQKAAAKHAKGGAAKQAAVPKSASKAPATPKAAKQPATPQAGSKQAASAHKATGSKQPASQQRTPGQPSAKKPKK